MSSIMRNVAVAAVALVLAQWAAPRAQAQSLTYSTSSGSSAITSSASPWTGYAASRSAAWTAYANQPTAWTGYRYVAPGSPLSRSSVPTQAADMVPRHVAYGYYYSPRYQNWVHAGYGGTIRNYGHAGRTMEMPRPWLWWGSQNY